MFKFAITLALLLATQISGLLAAEEVPKPFAFARYDGMTARSPFAVATAATPPPVAPNFAKDLFIANAAHSVTGDMITIASSTDKNFKKYVTTKEPVDGYSISNIEWSEKVGATKVTISKDGQFATLSFNQALLSQPLQNVAAPMPQPVVQPMGALPNGMGMPNQNVIKPAPIPQLPTPPPHVRGVIQRNPNAQVAVPAASPDSDQ